MSTKTWLIVGAVVVIGGGYLLIGNRSNSSLENEVASETIDTSLVTSAFSGSGSIKCDYHQDGGLVGTVYVKNGKVKIEGTVDGGTANVIYGSGKVYTWGESGGYPYAFVSDTATADEDIAAGTQALPSRADIENQFNNGAARCENYSVSDSFFTPPPAIKFQNMNDLMNLMPAGAGPGGY